LSEPNTELSEAALAPPPGWPDQHKVVDGVEEISQDPNLFADEDPESDGEA
jgi:hypothetical protein